MKPTMRLCCLVVSLFVSGSLYECGVGAFNLDPYSVTVLRHSSASSEHNPFSNKNYFGFSHALLREDNETWLLVGAPKANNSWDPSVKEPGAVYKCRLRDEVMKNNSCTELRMDFESETQSGYTSFRYNQWFGVSMDVSSTSGEFVACGHRQQFRIGSGSYRMGGVCYSRNDTKENATVIKSRIHGGEETVTTWNRATGKNDKLIYRFALSQWGISMKVSTEGHVVMGGPGLWQWQGGLYVNFDGSRGCAIENVTMNETYLGYSVASIRQLASNSEKHIGKFLFAGGAPRHMENGAVFIFETRIPSVLDITCSFEIIQEIRSTNYGSYFGASLLAEDTNADGSDELFIGAPFENQTLGDEGAVHYYVRNGTKNEFVRAKVLYGIGQGDARFGTAIASIGDLNFDGFNDVVIGSPFEDDGRGAIYIFNGGPNGVDVYSQRIAAKEQPALRSLKSFGHSLSSGRDIDENKYPDVSVGAYMSDSVAVIRARPVHTVSAEIWFPDSVISWQRPNCSKTSDDQKFEATLMVSFFYTIPEQEKLNIKDTYILVDYRNRSASLGPTGKVIFTDDQSPGPPLQFFVVPCLAEPTKRRCVSFLVVDRHATYLRLFDRNFLLDSMYTEKRSEDYKNAASFDLSEAQKYDKNMSMKCLAMKNYQVVSDENGEMTTRQMVTGERLKESFFSFNRGRYLPCIKGLSYELSIERESDGIRRGSLLHPDGGGARALLNFDVENIDQPVNKTWKIEFPKYPKNIANPMRFRLNISGPTFGSGSFAPPLLEASKDSIVFNRLSPVLSLRSKKSFTGEIGFKKECGDDDVCYSNLSVNMTLPTGTHSRGLVIGSHEELKLRFFVENSGEAAYSVRLEIVHPSHLPYNRLKPEDQCIEVTGSVFNTSMKESDNSSAMLRGLNCDVESQIHTNGSVAFEVHLDTTDAREESAFPTDLVELQCRIGTDGRVRNGTQSLPFTLPIRYEARLNAYGKSGDNGEMTFHPKASESKKSSERTLTFTQEYHVENEGPGLMPSVIVDVLLPDDSTRNVSRIIDVTVTVKGERSNKMFERLVNGSRLTTHAIPTTVVSPAENETLTSAKPEEKEKESIVHSLLTSTFAQDAKTSVAMAPDCATDPCSVTRRYKIGSLYGGDKVVVIIKVEMSGVILSKMDLIKLNYTSFVRLSPYTLFEDVKTVKEGKVEIVTKHLQTSTIFRPGKEPTPTPIWLILVGVGVGLLHIVAFVLILRKCGFFRRKQYEKMKSEIRESRIDHVMSTDAEAEQQDVASQYDNELLREQMSLKSQSQYSAAGSYGNGANGEETKRSISTVDALHAQHPGIDFTAE